MSLLVTSLLVGCGALLGRLIAQTPRVKGHRERREIEDAKPLTPEKEPPQNTMKMLEGFPCQLGDVVMRKAGDEAWLAGALVLSEGETTIAALFVAPEAGGDRVVLARPANEELGWLKQEPQITVISGEPPTALEVAGERYERRRRLPLRVERIGTGAPDVGRELIFAEYTGLGDECLVVLVAKERVVSFRGQLLASGTYDVLPGKTSE
jgi:hypothetical protein